MGEKIAICSGSFDPITNGHLDIITRASKLFDKVIVLISVNRSKKTSFTAEERQSQIKKCTKNLLNVSVDFYEGLLIEYAKNVSATVIIRGLRAITDFEYEFQMSLINKKMNPNIETIFLNTSSEYLYLSSSIVKEVAYFNGDISELVPKEVVDEVKERLLPEGERRVADEY